VVAHLRQIIRSRKGDIDAAAGVGEPRMKGRHKVLAAAALIVAIVGWFAWTMLTTAADLSR